MYRSGLVESDPSNIGKLLTVKPFKLDDASIKSSPLHDNMEKMDSSMIR